MEDVLLSRNPVYAQTQATAVTVRQDTEEKKKKTQKNRYSIWNACDTTTVANRTNE